MLPAGSCSESYPLAISEQLSRRRWMRRAIMGGLILELRNCICALMVFVVLAAPRLAQADAYDPPTGYYSGAAGTGTTLKSQLTTIMSTGHILRTYGDLRSSAAIEDADPDVPGNILLIYNRASVPAMWDNGVTWNREHIWPISLQGGNDPSNSTTGHRADPHALRPANPTINTSRGNSPFGLDNTTGVHGSAGGYYFPGDADKGDVARSLFYSATRWSSLGLTLVDTAPGAFQMGDLSSLLNWHYLDAPDTFERRRNHVIYSQAENPTYYTNNRNAYVDHPEYVWSVFVDQMNNSQIVIDGATVEADGSSVLNLDLGRVYVGGTAPGPQNVTLNKLGANGTYYSVATSGDATSSLSGRYNAFRTNATDSRQVQVGLNSATATSGIKSGTITIDNLDVTTDGGLGHGGNDANDSINLSLAVLDHPIASFSFDSPMNELTIDFGTVSLGEDVSVASMWTNLQADGAPSFAANLDLDSIAGSGDTEVLFTNLAAFSGLVQGDFQSFDAFFTPTSVGQFSAVYTLNLSDEDLPSEQLQTLTLNLLAQAVLAGDFNTDGMVDAADYVVWRDGLDTIYTLDDYEVWRMHFGETAGMAARAPAAVPEPASCLLLMAGATAVAGWRRRLGR